MMLSNLIPEAGHYILTIPNLPSFTAGQSKNIVIYTWCKTHIIRNPIGKDNFAHCITLIPF